MKNLLVAIACFVVLGLVAVDVSAGQNGKGKGKKSNASQKKGQKGQGAQQDSGQLAALMIQRFDRNGDRALNVQELSQAITAMREQRRNGQGKGGAGNRGKGGKGKGKGGKGKGKQPE